jgi:hypothetical protein
VGPIQLTKIEANTTYKYNIYMLISQMNNIIGITGKKFHGKDTIGDYYVKKGYTRIAFADTLKEACKLIFGLTHEQLYGDKKEVIDEYWKKTPREIMQYVGTDLFRNQFDENIWINSLRRKMISSDKKYVITDVRFDNEATMIKDIGGIIIKVNRTNLSIKPDSYSAIDNLELQGIKPDSYSAIDNLALHDIKPDSYSAIDNLALHESETNAIMFDYEVQNDGSINDLYEKLDRLC